MKYKLKRQNMLIVISAPSGGGKSTILKTLRDQDKELAYSVSATSRSPRVGEVNGVHYDFLSDSEFKRRINCGEFLEYAYVHNHLYGTLKEKVNSLLESGKDVVMDLDFQGGLNVKKQKNDSVLIFLMPPSFEILEKRLRDRQQDPEDVIQLRLKNAHEEMQYAQYYDYIIVNDQLNDTIEQSRIIIQAERCKASRIQIDKSDD